ncbi:hypothetical protein Goshw_022001, partial [Gossypium schwendimanii]|nr:hypothetical protein [Gossypium schwendimanii]
MAYLKAIDVDPRNQNLFVVVRLDGLFPSPQLIGDRQVGVEGLAISDDSELLVSYRDKSIYLFTRDMGLGHSGTEAVEKVTPQVYKRHGPSELVEDVSFLGPKSEYVSHPHTTALVSCGDEGIKIWTPGAIDKALLPINVEE